MTSQKSKFAAIAHAFDPEPRTAAKVAKELSFSGLLFQAYSKALTIPDLSATGRREFRHMLGSLDLQLVGLSGEIGPKGFGPGADLDRLIEQIDRAMQAAADMGSPLLCLDIGPLPTPPRQVQQKKPVTPEQAGLLILPPESVQSEPEAPPHEQSPSDISFTGLLNSAMTEIGARADRYRVLVAFSSALVGFAALEHAVNLARCPWFGVDLDPVALLSDEWSGDEVFSRLGSLIRHVRVRDAVVGTDHRTRPTVVGSGATDWPGLLARLDQSGYQGWLTVDPTELIDRVGAAKTARTVLASAQS